MSKNKPRVFMKKKKNSVSLTISKSQSQIIDSNSTKILKSIPCAVHNSVDAMRSSERCTLGKLVPNRGLNTTNTM